MLSSNLAILSRNKSSFLENDKSVVLGNSLIKKGNIGVFANRDFRKGVIVCYFAGILVEPEDLLSIETERSLQCNRLYGVIAPKGVSINDIPRQRHNNHRTLGWMINEPPSKISQLNIDKTQIKIVMQSEDGKYNYITVSKNKMNKLLPMHIYQNVEIRSEVCNNLGNDNQLYEWVYLAVHSLRPILDGEELLLCYGNRNNQKDYETTCDAFPRNLTKEVKTNSKKKQTASKKRKLVDFKKPSKAEKMSIKPSKKEKVSKEPSKKETPSKFKQSPDYPKPTPSTYPTGKVKVAMQKYIYKVLIPNMIRVKILVRLSSQTKEYKKLSSLYISGKTKVVNIWRIDKPQYQNVVEKRKNNPLFIKSIYAFHGTFDIEPVIQEGFKAEKATRKAHGDGIYFSSRGHYTLQFSKTNFTILSQLLLMKADPKNPNELRCVYDKSHYICISPGCCCPAFLFETSKI
jgi:hypothetical protein